MAKNTGYSSVSKDIQDIANLGLDRDFNVPMAINYVYNPATDQVDRMVQPGNETPTLGNNPIYKLHTNAGGDLVKVEKIIGATTYTKTTDVADQTITLVVTYSAWS